MLQRAERYAGFFLFWRKGAVGSVAWEKTVREVVPVSQIVTGIIFFRGVFHTGHFGRTCKVGA